MSRLAEMLFYYCNIYDGFLVGISERNLIYAFLSYHFNVSECFSIENSEHNLSLFMTETSVIVFIGILNIA